MAVRVTSTHLIGRAAELAELESALAAAAGGHPSIAFVAGESGVGKTRLLTELSERAREQGARTLCGDCVELGEGELPYGPLVAALRPLARDGDPVLAALPETARAELGQQRRAGRGRAALRAARRRAAPARPRRRPGAGRPPGDRPRGARDAAARARRAGAARAR